MSESKTTIETSLQAFLDTTPPTAKMIAELEKTVKIFHEGLEPLSAYIMPDPIVRNAYQIGHDKAVRDARTLALELMKVVDELPIGAKPMREAILGCFFTE